MGTFAEVGTQAGIGDLCGRSHYLRFLEANGDGWVDLVVGNAPPRPVSGDPCDNPANGLPSEENKLFLNVDGQRFQQAPASFGIGGYWGVRWLEVVDGDRDGRQDLLACSQEGLKLFRNDAGTGFVDISASVGLTTTNYSDAELAVAVGDADGNGTPDVYLLLAVPPAGGMGDAVVPLDGDANGRAEFLVLNGQEVRGPVQLIELVP